jgi:hypothetical protein
MDPTSREEFLQLQLWDIEEKEADRQGLTSYPCPCKKCMGARILDRKTIRKHLRKYKRDPEFKRSILVCYRYYFYDMLDVNNMGN